MVCGESHRQRKWGRTMSVFDCVEERLLLYTGIAYHGYGLWAWSFSGEGQLYYTNCPYEKELQSFFYLGKCLDYAIAQKNEPNMPFLMSDSVGLVWLGEYVARTDIERRFVVMGPAFQDRESVFGISDELWRLNISRELQQGYLQLLQDMPVVSLQQFKALAKMLHYANGFSDMEDFEIRLQKPAQQDAERVWSAKAIDYEQENHREKMLLQFVRDGNSGYDDVLDLFSRFEPNVYWSQSPLRSAKNAVLIFTAHCAQAAIEGGLPVQTSRELEQEFCQRVEQQKTATSVVNLCREMMKTFTEQVAHHKNFTNLSEPVYLCCSYIKKHLSEPLSLKGLADKMGYTEYYFARKFQEETGVRLLEYIKQTRLDYAKILLSTTNLTIQQISEKLQFGTRNYFTRIFKEHVGISPTEYRDNAWSNQGGTLG